MPDGAIHAPYRHQITVIHKLSYVHFLLKHSPYKRESKQFSIAHFIPSFSSLFIYHTSSKIKAFSYSLLYLHFILFFMDTILCPEMLLSYFLVKSYSFVRNQIKYHFLSWAIHDFPRIVSHPLYFHPKEFCAHTIKTLTMRSIKICLYKCFSIVWLMFVFLVLRIMKGLLFIYLVFERINAWTKTLSTILWIEFYHENLLFLNLKDGYSQKISY